MNSYIEGANINVETSSGIYVGGLIGAGATHINTIKSSYMSNSIVTVNGVVYLDSLTGNDFILIDCYIIK